MLDAHPPTHRVLIVDDQYVPRSLESMALEGTGRYYAIEAGSGTDALTLMTGEKFDCMVVDFSMPDMSGVELIEQVRSDPANDGIPIVLVLPEGAHAGATAWSATGASQVIAKPFEPWDLARVLDGLTGALDGPDHILSVEAVLRGFPYPTMIMDGEHRVLLANGAFYEATHTGVGECYVYCMEQMHEDEQVVEACPLEECVRTGKQAERTVTTNFGKMRVSVYPLSTRTSVGDPLYLHVTQPV